MNKAGLMELFSILAEWPLIIDDRPGLTLQEVYSRSRQAAIEYKDLGLICLDHLTEMRHQQKRPIGI